MELQSMNCALLKLFPYVKNDAHERNLYLEYYLEHIYNDILTSFVSANFNGWENQGYK